MLKRHVVFALAVTVITVLPGCAVPGITAAGSGGVPATVSPEPSVATPLGTVGDTQTSHGPEINWDAPIVGGEPSSLESLMKDGELTFTPRQPTFAVQPTSVQVSDPGVTAVGDRAVAYVYKFPVGSIFPTDGRVRVLEYATDSTELQLEGVAKNPPGPPEDFKIVSVEGHSALLVQDHGIGRIQFIQGGVMYDVTGPAVPVAVCEELTAEL